jgi:hypothetical protein
MFLKACGVPRLLDAPIVSGPGPFDSARWRLGPRTERAMTSCLLVLADAVYSW